jgi:6-phosphogluconolactonase/glucosamine-6-phosphate isomerase/deaminase
VVTVTGEEKRAAIERIRAGEDLPAARIRAERVLWLGDRAALGGH